MAEIEEVMVVQEAVEFKLECRDRGGGLEVEEIVEVEGEAEVVGGEI